MGSIEINYQKALRQAQDLEDLAVRVEKLSSDKLEDVLLKLSAGWKGDGAAAYLNKGVKLQSNLADTAKDIRTVARNIRKIAKDIFDADQAAERIARERTYR